MSRPASQPTPRLRLTGLVAAVAVMAGCAGSGAPERFFALNDGGGRPAATIAATDGMGPSSLPSIVVSAVTVPELVDRPQIVTRDNANRVIVSEQHLWAEPVRSGIGRTLASRLGRALAEAGRPAQVAVYPQTSIAKPTLRITLDVARFDAIPGGEAVVDVLWSIRRTADGVVQTGRSVAAAPIAGTSYEAVVAGWDQALATVDGDIAAAVLRSGVALPVVAR